jgi:CBS domain-containing protein
MRATTKPFWALTASDLMSREVVAIPRDMSLRAAAHLLREARITGAPVVDGDGRCIGVLSTSDFIKWIEQSRRICEPRVAENCFADWQVVDLEALPAYTVAEHMTGDPVTVPPLVSITDLARQMLDAHIHRIIVVDQQRRPIGVVSSTDILAAVAAANRSP